MKKRVIHILSENQRKLLDLELRHKKLTSHSNPSKVRNEIKSIREGLPSTLEFFFKDYARLVRSYDHSKTKEGHDKLIDSMLNANALDPLFFEVLLDNILERAKADKEQIESVKSADIVSFMNVIARLVETDRKKSFESDVFLIKKNKLFCRILKLLNNRPPKLVSGVKRLWAFTYIQTHLSLQKERLRADDIRSALAMLEK